MTRDASHSTSDVVTVFARQGIAISTIARAMAIPAERVKGMCERAHEADELQMMPPATPDDPRHALLVELTNLRAQLDNAQEEIRNMTCARAVGIGQFIGVAKLTKSEAAVVAAIVKTGRVNKTGIYHALYGGLDDPREPKIVDVLVCKARKKLKRHGIEIGTLWGTGYAMDAENVARLRELAAERELETIPVPRVESPSLAPAMGAAYP